MSQDNTTHEADEVSTDQETLDQLEAEMTDRFSDRIAPKPQMPSGIND